MEFYFWASLGMRAGVTLAAAHRLQARAARAIVEDALDANGWMWSRRLSRWLDVLVVIEEGA